jgi:glutathione S-transferase
MSTDYTLYYAPSACSISPHIALRESGLPYQLEKVDLRAKKLANGGDWLAINPKGYVPALRLPNGEILTEGAVMVQYIADQAPASGLAPPNGTFERVRLQEWMNFIATELHKGISPFFNSLSGEDYRKSVEERLNNRWGTLAAGVHGKPFVMGDRFTVVDGYAFYVLRVWQHALKKDLARWPDLVDYYARLAVRPSVAAALDAEGIKA